MAGLKLQVLAEKVEQRRVCGSPKCQDHGQGSDELLEIARAGVKQE